MPKTPESVAVMNAITTMNSAETMLMGVVLRGCDPPREVDTGHPRLRICCASRAKASRNRPRRAQAWPGVLKEEAGRHASAL